MHEFYFVIITSYMKNSTWIWTAGLLWLTMILGAGAWAAEAGAAVEKAIKEEITPISEVRRGQHVTLRGTVDRIRDEDTFILRDDTGKIRIYIGWKNRMPVGEGASVTVEGRADDDGFPGLRPEVYATALLLANGDRVDLRTGKTTPSQNRHSSD